MPPAENIKTMAVVLAVVGAFFLANHWDNDASLEWAASDAATAQANDVAHQQRIERAAQEMCGPQAATSWIDPTTVQCTPRRGIQKYHIAGVQP